MPEDLHANLPIVVYVKNPREVVLNRGQKQGAKTGDKFLVFGIGEDLTDPTTGESLGRLELVRGRGQVTHVQESMVTVRCIEVRSSVRKRILSPTISMLTGTTTEIDQSAEELPFDDVQKGDYARQI